MFKRKVDVDKHVASVLSRKRSDKDRNTLGLQIARLYTDIHEYSTAKMYLSGYLNVQETVAPAHQLMGEINEALGFKEAAVNSFRRALEIECAEKSQEYLLKKICDLYSELGMDEDKLKYCIEKCEVLMPKSDIVNRFEKKISAVNVPVQNSNVETVNSNKILKTDCPQDAYRRTVKCNLNLEHSSCLDWLESSLKIFEIYRTSYPDCMTDFMYNQQLLHILRNLTYYSIGCRDISSISHFLTRFDLHIKHCDSLMIKKESWNAMLNEMKGQLLYNAGLLLLKKAILGLLPWEEAIHNVGVCFVVCQHIGPLDDQTCNSLLDLNRCIKFYKWWHLQSYDRLSQVGHVLMQLSHSELFFENPTIRPYVCNIMVICQEVFMNLDIEELKNSFLLSHLNAMDEISDMSKRLSWKELTDIDTVAVELHVKSLPNLVWLCLQHYTVDMDAQPTYDFIPIETFMFKARYLPLASDETVSHLDMFVFLLAAVRCAANLQWCTQNHLSRRGESCPILLPLCLISPVCSEQLENFWSAAYECCTHNLFNKTSQSWREVQLGVDTVRLIGFHGMSVMMCAHIARSLDAKVRNVIEIGLHNKYSASDLVTLENLAAFYWSRTEESLNNISSFPISHCTRLFSEAGDQSVPVFILAKITEEVQFALARQAMNSNQLGVALQAFSSARTLWAKYYMALMYKLLGQTNAEESKGNATKQTLLLKARHCLSDIQDKLHKENSLDKLYVLSCDEYKELDREITCMNNGCNHSSSSPVHKLNQTKDCVYQKTLTSGSSFPHNATPTRTVSQDDNVPWKKDSTIESLMVKMLLERNCKLILQNQKLVVEIYQSKQELREKDFSIQKLKTDVMSHNLLHSCQL
ncbi:ranBP2-like and GRIP domain-containing protein 4 isoform X2 [Biomphalaria glabrata]|uniref:RanBP2-like and GRIP domain-containing protein 4 isoform X2 n=1 Tax=Biomphalaria glabrata TaxID=6526 RepID=A0A9W3BFL7_BIOGL|nr:ranBP2-like and GRIP domain-containing protein 4 isoform X2 [Biomphalaria glabrata]